MGKGPLLESRICIKEISVVADLCEQIVLHRKDKCKVNQAFKSAYANYVQPMSGNLNQAFTALVQGINSFYSRQNRCMLLSDLFSLGVSLRKSENFNYRAAGDVLSCAVYTSFFDYEKLKKEDKTMLKVLPWEFHGLNRSIKKYWG